MNRFPTRLLALPLAVLSIAGCGARKRANDWAALKEVDQALAGGRIKDAEEALSHGTFREAGSTDYAPLREKIRAARETK